MAVSTLVNHGSIVAIMKMMVWLSVALNVGGSTICGLGGDAEGDKTGLPTCGVHLPNCSTQCNNGTLKGQSGFHYSSTVQCTPKICCGKNGCDPASYGSASNVGNVYNITVCCIAGGTFRGVEAFISGAPIDPVTFQSCVGLGQNCALAFGCKQHFLGLVLRNGVSNGNCYSAEIYAIGAFPGCQALTDGFDNNDVCSYLQIACVL
eukprot:TRINITY_DN2_c0_g1_i1.p1 TRINITY_DN2_c0_g1~~TRINITY_DN2_c0_g1_i1.p1  ORF type:complete len:206 (+),score=2.53 TRINITY_DN2_c0_g1_i1:75-692(+)